MTWNQYKPPTETLHMSNHPPRSAALYAVSPGDGFMVVMGGGTAHFWRLKFSNGSKFYFFTRKLYLWTLQRKWTLKVQKFGQRTFGQTKLVSLKSSICELWLKIFRFAKVRFSTQKFYLRTLTGKRTLKSSKFGAFVSPKQYSSSERLDRPIKDTELKRKITKSDNWSTAYVRILDRPIKIDPTPFDSPLFCYALPPILLRTKKNCFRRFSLKCSSASAAPSTVSPECVPTRNPSKNQFLGRFLLDFWSVRSSSQLADREMTQNRPKIGPKIDFSTDFE